MATRPRAKRILDTVPTDDQGSEAFYGFDYQVHVITRLALEMTAGHEVSATIAEYHEDVVQLRTNKPARFCQVKKRESAEAWTIGLLEKAIEKLLSKAQFQDVGELILYGSGRPSTDGPISLSGLMVLLDKPSGDRDGEWETQLEIYIEDLARRFESRLDEGIIRRGLGMLQIQLNMPHPEAIESNNVMRTIKVIRDVWGADVTLTVAQKACDALHKRVEQACAKPKQTLSVKGITVKEARDLLRDVLRQENYLAEDSEALVGSQKKLQRCGLDEYLPYVLQMRLDARQVKFELDLTSADWQSSRDAIGTAWEDFTYKHPGLTGKRLWADIRQLLQGIGQNWITAKGNANMGPEFVEGVFFDMLSICEVDLRC